MDRWTDWRIDGRTDGRTDGEMDGQMDGRTKPLIELLFATKYRLLHMQSDKYILNQLSMGPWVSWALASMSEPRLLTQTLGSWTKAFWPSPLGPSSLVQACGQVLCPRHFLRCFFLFKPSTQGPNYLLHSKGYGPCGAAAAKRKKKIRRRHPTAGHDGKVQRQFMRKYHEVTD